MILRKTMHALAAGLALTLAACGGGGSNIASPGATNPGTPPGTGGPGTGGPGTGGGATCPSGLTNGGALGSFTICLLTGEILSNLTLPNTANVVYRINGRVDVGRDVGAAGTGGQSATLTIDPGVRLFGDEVGDVMIVNRGSRILASGTPSQPIIFTSREDLLNQNDPSTSSRQWAGLILLGRAPIKGCNAAVTQGSVDCINDIEGVELATGRTARYGGATAADTSGTLQYVQIRYPGAFLPSGISGNDLNGLTLGGVGSGTTIDHVQIHNSGDDGVEIFGGTVNMKYLVVTGAQDDSIDCDEGWAGNIQFAVVRQTTRSASEPDKLVECSNRTVASLAGTAINTNPTIANFTFVGAPGTGIGVEFNNSSGTPGATGRLVNGVVTGSTSCFRQVNGATAAPLPVLNSILFNTACTFNTDGQAAVNAGTNITITTPTLSGVLPGSAERNAPSINPNTLGSFFSSADYVGAFADNETVATNWAAGWTIQLLPAAGCPAGTNESGLIAGQRNCVLAGTLGQGSVPAVLQLTAGNIYEIAGRVDVGVDRGAAGTGGVAATLTIDPGVILYGDANNDVVIVNRGSQIFANGTRQAPVVFTSRADLTNTQADPITASREWAGLILLGRAPIRGCNSAVTQGSVQCENEIEGVTLATGREARYGGATAADNSGRLQYVQIKYPGAFLPSGISGNDLNGLTLGGVGSGTEINFVQVHNSGDDGIEIFGGAVNMKNVILTGAQDDSLDCDEGWNGLAQFIITVQRAISASEPDKLIECSNRTVASLSGTTITTNPIIANFTFVSAPGTGLGIEFNNSSGTPGATGRLINGVVTGTSGNCLRHNPSGGSPVPVLNSILFNNTCTFDAGGQAAVTAGTTIVTNQPATLTSIFVNGANEAAVAATNASTVNAFFTATTYVGAVRDSADTWWQSWACGLGTGTSAC